MKIFILEDMKPRIQWFRDNLNKEGIALYFAKDVREAKQILDEHDEFDMAFLDHDLGEKTYVLSSDPNCGFQVAKYIVEKGTIIHDIVIHSWNEYGVKAMKSLLPKAKCERFGTFKVML